MPATGIDSRADDKKSIRLTPDGFSFFPANSEVVVVVGRPTWMPMSDFRAESVAAIYNKVYAPQGDRVARYSVLPTLEVIELCDADREMERQIREGWPSYRWVGADGVALERLWAYEKRRGQGSGAFRHKAYNSGRRLYVYMHDGEMLTVLFNDKGLYFANSFWPADLEEARYMLFAVWQRLSLDAEKDELLLVDGRTGHALENTEAFTELLNPYLRHVAALTPDLLRLAKRANLPFDLLCV